MKLKYSHWVKRGAAAALTVALCCVISACDEVDSATLESEADYSVKIDMPYATATPLPDYMNVPDPVVIDVNGGVKVNDETAVLGSSTSKSTDESSYQTLSLGNTGLAVQALQSRLSELNYYSGSITGIFDATTETAVKRFEQTYGVMQTGIATPSFQAQLFSSNAPYYGSDEYTAAVDSQYNTLQKGAVGSEVYALQHRLKELGYPITDLTAVYDDQTANAVMLFYQAYGLEPQTVAHRAILKQIYSETARTYGEETVVTDTSTLTKGNVGTVVMQIQEQLISLGYMEGTATGVFDTETENAVKLFEKACGFEETGVLTYELQGILLSDQAPEYGSTYIAEIQSYPDLTLGDEGEDVVKLQNKLIDLGYATGAGNGIYGEETAAAVKMFRRYNGFDESGDASAAVQAAMFSPTAITYEDVLNGVISHSTSTTVEDETQTATEIEEEEEVIVPEETVEPEPEIETVLTLGSAGDAVKALQDRLNELGYSCAADGLYDETTASAMRDFQAAIGLTQSGEASVSMQKYIQTKAAPGKGYRFFNATQDFTTLMEGDESDDVLNLQKRLWELGYLLTESVEGSKGTFNNATKLAVASAQLAMGYTETDGIASPEFQCFLMSDYAEKYIKK